MITNEFKPYQGKPITRMAFQITKEHGIVKSELADATYFCNAGDVQTTFKAYEEPKVGDWIVRLSDEDTYHCTNDVFLARNIVNQSNEDVTAFGSIDALATVVYNWHKQGVKLANHMIEIPEGTEMTYSDKGVTSTMVLEGNILIAFKAGIANVLAELGTLPFYAELEDGTSTETNESNQDEPNA